MDTDMLSIQKPPYAIASERSPTYSSVAPSIQQQYLEQQHFNSTCWVSQPSLASIVIPSRPSIEWAQKVFSPLEPFLELP
jgi:hypothetical protein